MKISEETYNILKELFRRDYKVLTEIVKITRHIDDDDDPEVLRIGIKWALDDYFSSDEVIVIMESYEDNVALPLDMYGRWFDFCLTTTDNFADELSDKYPEMSEKIKQNNLEMKPYFEASKEIINRLNN